VSTRRAFGDAVLDLFKKDDPQHFRYVVLDGDVGNSTFTELTTKAFPERSVQCWIAEMNMISVATALDRLGFTPIVSTFACFLTRAYDQLRMNNITGAKLKI